jgi:flagellar motility protein MotE (MotC chaperone)
LKAYVNRAKALESDQNQAERSKIETLANLFLSMPAQQAGSLLAGLENDVIAEILIKMPERRSAALLAQLPRDRGVKIAKLMAEFKNPAE